MNDDTKLIIASLDLLGQIAEPLLRDDPQVQKDVIDFIGALKHHTQEQALIVQGSRIKGKVLSQQGLQLLRSLAPRILRDNTQVQQAFISFLDTI
jgi:predicted metal-dependent hydrolase